MTPADLKTYRLSTGRNCRQFGEYLGCTGAAVSAWECGRNPLPKWLVNHIDTLKRLESLENPTLPIPPVPGLCFCGCGGFTEINHRNDASKGWVRGEYRHFLKGHNSVFKSRESHQQLAALEDAARQLHRRRGRDLQGLKAVGVNANENFT